MSKLKTLIDASIKENGNQEITGKVLNYVLNKIAEETQKDWNESDATKGGYIKGRTHGVTYEYVSVEGTLKELGYVPREYVSVLHYARVNGDLEGKGLYLGGLLYNPIVGEEYRAKYEGPSVYARVVEVEDGYDVQIKGANDTGDILKVAIVEYKKIDDAYISTDIARKSQVDALEDKVDNLPQGEAFDKQGNYPLLHAGTADDLAGRGESVPAEFTFRASGGKSIKDGRAYIKRIKGNSVVWNQHYPTGWNWSQRGVETNSSNGVITSVGVMETTFFNIQPFASNIANHRYLFIVEGLSSTFSGNFGLLNRIDKTKVVNGFAAVFHTNSDTSLGRSVGFDALTAGTEINETYTVVQYDLTQMFGAGNEPSTIEEYNARVATLGVDMYAYNEGEVIHCNTESIKSVGDNAWDEQWDSGYIDPSTGKDYTLAGYLRSKNLIPVVSGEYHVTKPSNASDFQILGYDHEGNIVASSLGKLVNGNLRIEVAPNIGYIRFYCNYGSDTYKNDIMITLVHSGWKQDTDAGYQPYWQDTLPLPIIRKYFPQGMKSAGSAHDEIQFNKASGKWEKVVRIGSVDLGTLEWSRYADGFYLATNLTYAASTTWGVTQLPNVVSSRYAPALWDAISESNRDKACSAYDSQVRVSDTDYTDAASFKAAMQGVTLYYELAEPIVTEITEDFRDYYNVADFGTEQSQSSVPSAAFSADIIYQFNAVDMIREHELEITELQSIIATMQAQLASLTNS